MSEDKKIPKGVVDLEMWELYLEAQAELENHPDKIIIVKDLDGKDIYINLAATVYIIKKQLKNVKEELHKDILDKVPEFRKMIVRMSVLKRKAFGNLSSDNKTEETDGLGPVAIKKAEIIDLFGRFYNLAEVHKIITLDWGYDISIESIRQFKNKSANQIIQLQKEYEENFSDVRLGKRRSRLDELSWIYSKTKDKYIRAEAREDAKLMQSLLESIKKECDGDLVINAKMEIDVQHTINLQIQQDLMKGFNITALIISKLAAKKNINPLFIISRLAHSQYAKFTGFQGASYEEMQTDEIYSPTGISYNWDEIITQNAEVVEEDDNKKSLPSIKKPEVTKTFKEEMLEKIKAKQRRVKDSISDVELNAMKNS